jgi:predicted Zn finger-like uncharacterized protein
MEEEPRKEDTGIQKVYVGPDHSATVTCPHCGIRYRINALKVQPRGVGYKLRCKCGKVYSAFFEFRENERRTLLVDGFYRKLKEIHVRGTMRKVPASQGGLDKMEVRNISRNGIGFLTRTGHDLKVDDKIEVMFKLDDEEGTRIERAAVVRRLAKDNYVGCQFMDVGHFDPATGLYITT